jgi:hypothetical protein
MLWILLDLAVVLESPDNCGCYLLYLGLGIAGVTPCDLFTPIKVFMVVHAVS